MGFLDSLRHAFDVGPPEPPAPTDSQQRLIDALCGQIVERELTTPALVFLESVRPLNYITAQSLQFFAPILASIGGQNACEVLARFLEHRGAIDVICRRIEELDRAQTVNRSVTDTKAPGKDA